MRIITDGISVDELTELAREGFGDMVKGVVDVARGIMAEPKTLMIDELSLGLAPVLALQLFEALKQLKVLGITLLLVEQNVQMALAISDYAYVISEGRIELEGPSRDVARDDHVRAAYLGL